MIFNYPHRLLIGFDEKGGLEFIDVREVVDRLKDQEKEIEELKEKVIQLERFQRIGF